MPYRRTVAPTPTSPRHHSASSRGGAARGGLVALALLVGAAPLGAQCWTEGASAPTALEARAGHAAAFNPQTGRLVVFGGTDRAALPLDDTWEYGPLGWTQGPAAPGGLTARSGHKMVYDARKNRIVMFGGVDAGGYYYDETWEYDGNWQRGAGAPNGLYGRSKHAMAYDSYRQRVVLFGGHDTEYLFNDTWELDQNGWSYGAAAPLELYPRAHHTMAFDEQRGVTVLFGGDIGFADWVNDTWETDGTTWYPGALPDADLAPRGNHSMTYDSSRGVIVMFGGWDIDNVFNDTWEYDGSTWYYGAPAHPNLAPRHASSLDYDLGNRRSLLFGGYNPSQHFAETWELRAPCCPNIVVSPATLPGGYVSLPYSQTITASGGAAPYTFLLTNGALPSGLTLSSSGVLSGTPTAAGAATFTIDVVDATGCRGRATYTLTIAACSVQISPSTLPAGTVGVPYSQAMTASGGVPPYAFSIVAGGLPVGLSLSAGGVLSGTPSFTATFGFDVGVTDGAGCVVVKPYAITVSGSAGATDDIVAGQGLGQPSPNRVKGFRQDGSQSLDFIAYAAGQWGVNVATGNATSATVDHLLTGPGPGVVYGPHVRGFTRTGRAMKISFFAYGTLRYGANVTAANVDADGFDEIVTGAGPGAVFGPHVRGFAYDDTAVAAVSKINYFAYGTLKYGVNVAAGNVDGDSFQELLTGPGPGSPFGPQVRGWDFDDTALTSIGKVNFAAFQATTFGANVASGDVENDGYDEILAALGPGAQHAARIRAFDFDGSAIVPTAGFDLVLPVSTVYGARVGAGDVTGDGSADLLAGAGRDPAAPSIVRPYAYTSSSLFPLLAFDAFPGGTYGVNVAAGALGF